MDGFVFSNICDVARNLSSIYQRNFGDVLVEYLHLPQNSTSPAVAAYMAAELKRLAARFEDAWGLRVTPTALAKSIETFNTLRAGIRALYALRIAEPQKLSTVELYTVLRALTMAPPEDGIAWVQTLLERHPADGARARATGCAW